MAAREKRSIGSVVRRASSKRPAEPAVRVADPGGYSGTPLPKKLGLKPGGVLGLDGAPYGFEALLQPWPDGAVVVREARRVRDLTLWFVRTRAELERGLEKRVPRSVNSGLWIVWPKLTSALSSGLREGDIRTAALAAGMVDFKVCAVDADWSGLRFNRRAADAKRSVAPRAPRAGGR